MFKNIPVVESGIMQGNQEKQRLLEEIASQVTPSGPMSLGDFKLEFFADDIHLRIEGENLKTTKFYSRKLNSEELIVISSNLISSPVEMYENLCLAINKKLSDLTISITENGVITMTQNMRIGVKYKDVSFTIALNEQDIKPLEAMEKYLEKLPETKGEGLTVFESQLIKIFQKVVDHNHMVEEKLAEVQERLSKLENQIKQ